MEDKQIFLALFNLVFRFFVNVEKYIPTKLTCKSVVSEHSVILVCLILHPREGGGGDGTLMKLSFDNYATLTIWKMILF